MEFSNQGWISLSEETQKYSLLNTDEENEPLEAVNSETSVKIW